MDIDATFLPVAIELIDEVFPTAILYRRLVSNGYDPATGQVQQEWAEYPMKAGVTRRSRTEGGGPEETYELNLWIHHGATGLPVLPTTGDEVIYDDVRWKVSSVAPTFSSAAPIASKITARAPG